METQETSGVTEATQVETSNTENTQGSNVAEASTTEEVAKKEPVRLEDVVDFGSVSVDAVREWHSGDTVMAGTHSVTEVEMSNRFEDDNVAKLFAVYFDEDADPVLLTTSIFSPGHAGIQNILRTNLGIIQGEVKESEGLVSSSLAQRALDLIANRYQSYFFRAKSLDSDDTDTQTETES